MDGRGTTGEGAQQPQPPRSFFGPGGRQPRQAEHGFFHGLPGPRLESQAAQGGKGQQRQAVFVTEIHSEFAPVQVERKVREGHDDVPVLRTSAVHDPAHQGGRVLSRCGEGLTDHLDGEPSLPA